MDRPESTYEALHTMVAKQSDQISLDLSTEVARIVDGLESLALRKTPTPRFTLFSSFPPEIRDMIWSFSLPSDTQEVCLLEKDDDGMINTSPIIWVKFPVIMHVCQEARNLAKLYLQFRYWEDGKCWLPCRNFRPDLDMYVLTPKAPLSSEIAATLRYVALDARPNRDRQVMFLNALPHLKNLETLSLMSTIPATLEAYHKKHKLRPLRRVTPITFPEQMLRWIIRWRESLNNLAKNRLSVWDDDTKAAFWDEEKQALKIQIKIDLLIHYT
ncbi:hypothetical protein F5Y00DRAFT_271904 [Daldinia vernicosa]|uniref:uncharacterized protein n=1 Tax=Daldinia vernicosa TaxID=114800 RepID=UPI0020077D62|nr:uncharacterized protein F5Y00DRAFT_271904 [Daldinia vernicosa]KAI0846607.1 hypothetical protein F5Y00DRAFT_271904 [Daldinia vernicosa]